MKIKGVTQKDILLLAFSFFLVVFAWIGFNLYHVWATSTITEDIQEQMRPIEKMFDTATIEEIKKRQQVVPLYELTGQPSSPSATPTPEVIEPTATPTPTEIVEEEIPIEEEPPEELVVDETDIDVEQ